MTIIDRIRGQRVKKFYVVSLPPSSAKPPALVLELESGCKLVFTFDDYYCVHQHVSLCAADLAGVLLDVEIEDDALMVDLPEAIQNSNGTQREQDKGLLFPIRFSLQGEKGELFQQVVHFYCFHGAEPKYTPQMFLLPRGQPLTVYHLLGAMERSRTKP